MACKVRFPCKCIGTIIFLVSTAHVACVCVTVPAILDLTVAFTPDSAKPTLRNIILGKKCKAEMYLRYVCFADMIFRSILLLCFLLSVSLCMIESFKALYFDTCTSLCRFFLFSRSHLISAVLALF